MTQRHALVLTGIVLPGFDAARTWPELAARLRIDPVRLRDEVLARAPVTIKEGDDPAALGRLRDEVLAAGAEAEVHALDADGNVFALVDNVPRGPLPRRFVAERIRRGIWPAGVRVAAVGSRDWVVFDAAPTAAVPVASYTAPVSLPGEAGRLPPGLAIHAGFWRRSAAYILDYLILFIPLVLVNIVPILGALVGIVGVWLYFALQESSPAQATLGKRAMGIKATDDQGRRLGFGQATGRYFAAALSVLVLYIGYMLAGWTERKQGLHDLVAGTCVVFDDVEPGRLPARPRPPMPWYGWVANGFVLLIFPVAILAAISIPAYQDYVHRAKIAAVASEAMLARIEVAEARAAGEPCPQATRPGNDPLAASLVLAGEAPHCTITLTLAASNDLPASARGETIEWVYADDANWECSATLPGKLAPRECR